MAQYQSVQQVRQKARFPIRLLLLVALLVAGAAVYYVWSNREQPFPVTIEVLGESVVQVEIASGTVGDALLAAGIEVRSVDRVVPSLDEPLTPELAITVERAKAVRIHVDGETQEHWIVADSVRDALQAAGVALGPLDRVQPAQSAPLDTESEIRIVRVVEEFIEETQTLPFKEVRWAAPDLERGQRRVIREGQEGIIRNTVRVVYEDGKPVNRSIVGSEVLQEVVDRVIGEGTRPPTKTVNTPSGPLPYVDVIEMVATGYEPGPISTGEWADGLTFTGLKAQRGVAAVDPTVIPLGTRLYVEGYGEAIAADIGGAIKGYRIDLCFDTYEEAIQWGRKTVKVYILAD